MGGVLSFRRAWMAVLAHPCAHRTWASCPAHKGRHPWQSHPAHTSIMLMHYRYKFRQRATVLLYQIPAFFAHSTAQGVVL